MDKFGISKLDLKRRNRMQVLKLLRRLGPTSRIDISGILGITRAAITIITNEMIGQGIVYEKGEASYVGKKVTRGRKKILIDINANNKFAFGIAVDNNVVEIGLTNLTGETLEKAMIPVDANVSLQNIIEETARRVDEIRQNNCLEISQVVGVGFCVSPDQYGRMGVKYNNFTPDFSDLKKEIAKVMQYNIAMSDTVNALALAEIDFKMTDIKPDNILLFRYTNEITAASIIDNQPYRGANGRGINFAHLQIETDGKLCTCGKTGCLETVASNQAIIDKISDVYSKENTPDLFEASGGNRDNIKVIFKNEMLMTADEAVSKICTEAADKLIRAISNTVCLFDPEKIVVMGTVFKNEEFFNYIADNIAKNAKIDAADKIYVSSFDKKDIYLAGCSIAIRDFFIERGGFKVK